MTCVFTVDVEDWYHLLDLPGDAGPDRWPAHPARLEANVDRIFNLLARGGAQATCFFLGWAAARHPRVVRAALAAGHEVASHGYGHDLVYRMTPEAFEADVRRARDLLQQLAGQPVPGFRAAGFSVTARTPWFFDRLAAAGHTYDSSVFPARRGHGGLPGASLAPYAVTTRHGTIHEFPISTRRVLGRPVCFFGGGYLRLSPYPVIRRAVRSVLRSGRPVIFYLHPRDLDPGQPRLPMPLIRRFQSYVNLASTADKVRRLLDEFPVTSFERSGLRPSAPAAPDATA